MKLTELILEQLDREEELTRRVVAKVPEGKNNWKPHPKSMPLGRLAHMVATMLSWNALIIRQDELDIRPANGAGSGEPRELDATAALVKALEKAATDAREAVYKTTDEHLRTPWKLLAGGKIASEKARYSFIFENFGHLAHHRGQLTVYLRLNDSQVPATYGPSADDPHF